VTPVHGVLVKGDDLVIGTHGRSFYLMDNINVLRQIARDTTNEPVVLFKPGDATRSVSRGVAIDYYLKQPADKLTIEILDAQGAVIRTFTGTPQATPPAATAGTASTGTAAVTTGAPSSTAPATAAAPPATPAAATTMAPSTAPPATTAAPPAAAEPAPPPSADDTFRPPPPQPAVKQGLNRFVWDTRYPDAKDFKGLIMWAGSVRGPAAPPGQYQVRLSAAGQTKTQPFAILRNVKASASDADLQEQFKLASQIGARVSAANETVVRIRALKDQIADRVTKANDPKIKSAGEALTTKLTGVEGEIYQYRNRSGQDPLNFPIKLNNKLAALQGIVEAGDYRPTDQSYAVFKDLSAQLEKQLEWLDSLVRGELGAFNQQIAKKKLAPVAGQ
jgi:hypothetical protein